VFFARVFIFPSLVFTYSHKMILIKKTKEILCNEK